MTRGGRRLPETARVDEKTVQKVAAGEVPSPPRRRRKPIVPAEPITTLRVNEEVWAIALGLAEQPNHIQIISEDEVIVWNHPRPWPG